MCIIFCFVGLNVFISLYNGILQSKLVCAKVIFFIIFALIDLLFAYATNFFFKSYEEKRADIFATRFSSKEEIKAAADFFEHYERAAQKYRETIDSILFKLPTTIVSGYIDGINRAHYLREYAQSK